MVLLREQTVKPDFVHVVAPVLPDGAHRFWTPCRTGKLPTEGKCEGGAYAQSFSFLTGHNWEMQRKIEAVLGYKPTHGWYNLRTQNDFRRQFLLAIPRVMERHGFKTGRLTAIGTARRPSKGAWEFTTKGGNVQITEHFILAKLMDKEVFEADIWVEAVMQAFPDLWKTVA